MKLRDGITDMDDNKYFQVVIKVPKKTIVNMFVGACEGGSNYWCKDVRPKGKASDCYDAMLDGFTCIDMEDNNRLYEVTAKNIERAVFLMFQDEPRHFGHMMSENDDATTADVFFQLCVFGKTVYG